MIEHVRDLSNPDPAKRRRAIMELGKTGDPAALKPLAEVYRTDPSVELRELARQAGVYIRKQEQAAVEQASGPHPTERKISEIDVRRARAYTDEALTFNLEGNNDRAVNSLHKALQVNPALVEDTYFTGMASVILGVAAPEAIALLKDANQRGDFSKNVKRAKQSAEVDKHMEEARKFTWRGVGIELSLFALIAALGPPLGILILGQSIQQLLSQPKQEGVPDFAYQLGWLVDIAASPLVLLVIAVVVLLAGFLNLMAQGGMIHLIARYLLRGKGTFGYLLYKATSLVARYMLIVFVVGALAVAIGIGSGAFFLVYAVAFVLTLFSLLTVIKLAGRVAEAYHFGASMGCASILLAVVALGIPNAALFWIISQVFTSLLSGIAPPT